MDSASAIQTGRARRAPALTLNHRARPRALNGLHHRFVAQLDEDLEIGLRFRLTGDFFEHERVHVAARRDEVEIGARPVLGRLHIGEVLAAVDDPELFIAANEIKDLLVFREHDQRRKAQPRVDSDNVFVAVLNRPRPVAGGRCGC